MRKTTDRFVQDANAVHNGIYDYTHVVYVNNATPITIICKTHGPFVQTPKNHINNKSGCPICAVQTRQQTNMIKYGARAKKHTEETKQKKKQTSLERYGVEHPSQSVEVQAKILQTTVSNYGVSRSTQTQDILEHRRSNNINKYGVPSPKQQHMTDSLHLLMNRNWLFDQYHIHNKTMSQIAGELGVERSTIGKYLRQHNIEINKYYPQSNKCINWLNAVMQSENIHIQHARNGGEFNIPDTKYSVDGYCAETNTVYEFYGDFWHGSPVTQHPNTINTLKNKTMKQLFEDTITREQHIRSLGYNVIVMWEHDYEPIATNPQM